MQDMNELEIDAVNGAGLFGKIVGGLTGAVVGGPLGAKLGSMAGDKLQDAVNEFGEKHGLN